MIDVQRRGNRVRCQLTGGHWVRAPLPNLPASSFKDGEPMPVNIDHLDIVGLPDDAIVIDAVILYKCLDTDGTLMLCERWSSGLSRWEVVGMATTFLDGIRRSLLTQDDEP